MAFVNQEIKAVLTTKGKKTLIEKGLSNINIYYTFYDNEVIYTLNAYPNLITELNGSSNNISDMINSKYSLK